MWRKNGTLIFLKAYDILFQNQVSFLLLPKNIHEITNESTLRSKTQWRAQYYIRAVIVSETDGRRSTRWGAAANNTCIVAAQNVSQLRVNDWLTDWPPASLLLDFNWFSELLSAFITTRRAPPYEISTTHPSTLSFLCLSVCTHWLLPARGSGFNWQRCKCFRN